MLKATNHFYKDRVALNVLANGVENAKEIYDAAEGYVLVGVLSKDYPTVEAAVTAMKEYGEQIEDAVSIGLGAGDNRQAAVVADIAKYYAGSHINQVFPAVGATIANLAEKDSWINALVSPSGSVGYVNISTGSSSAAQEVQAIVPIKAAIALIIDMGGIALKYFTLTGLASIEVYGAVERACRERGCALQSAGGIDNDNFEEILRIAIEANVPRVVPLVYASIMDKETGDTNTGDVSEILSIIKEVVD